MDVEVAPFNLFSTAPRGPWCDAITRFTHYGPISLNFAQSSLASTTDAAAAQSTPRSHNCESTCFAGDVDIASLTNFPVDMTAVIEIEEASRVEDRYAHPLRRSPPPRLSRSQQQRQLLDIRKDDAAASGLKPRFTFTTSDPKTRKSSPLTFKFEPTPTPPKTSVKRPRSAADVDGPNTAALSSKKRRLRLELITSRLSQPFSLPATHILNREALAAGDKRFLKMATHAEMVRRGDLNSSSSSIRRFAILNKTRATLKDCNWTELGGYLACRRPSESRRSSPSPSPPCSPVASAFPTPPAVVRAKLPLATSKAAQSLPSLPSPPPCSRQAAAAASAAKPLPSPTSPLSRSIEPTESDPERRSIYDEDDDCEAFSYTGYDSDDAEDVYSDFSAIFGSGTTATVTEDVHSFEDYLDELDGISWAIR
ncbi:uncharacterized protein DNG_05788 [Cephalotrichum gorgonifer]|uniref:Uncharacterized protein n=1 Tax=Cephalotrichum gorgonifer TaxID=2041049 RepID=A0AAE8SVT2_9PEZI|nr:uncharacterized protein DNG_05788 [Cephalotrichum gorgonifer]